MTTEPRRVDLVDAKGEMRALLKVAEDGPMLILSDARGMPIWGGP
jgi:hypothetical protein